jgi:DNA/RNA-binding protein KIN17
MERPSRASSSPGVLLRAFPGDLKTLEGGDTLRMDQEDLETVIPTIGGTVMILNGRGKGCKARLLDLDVDNYSASVEVEEGNRQGEVLRGVQYEDICKVNRDAV